MDHSGLMNQDMVGKMKTKQNLIDKINRIVFYGDFQTHFYITLWRLTKGNREQAFKTIRRVMSAYKLPEVSDDDLDDILGELNNGVEIEWNSLEIMKTIAFKDIPQGSHFMEVSGRRKFVKMQNVFPSGVKIDGYATIVDGKQIKKLHNAVDYDGIAACCPDHVEFILIVPQLGVSK